MDSALSPVREAVLARNNVRIVGSGSRTMVFAHGFGCDQNMWRYLMPAFEADYRCVLFDYVGCGKSDLSAFSATRYGTLDGYTQDLLEVCEALQLRDAVFVGHSVSSMIGLLAAVRQPKYFSSLVMIGPSPRYLNDGPGYTGGFEREDIEGLLSLMEHNYLGWAAHLAPMLMANTDRPALSGELEQSFCSTDPKTARIFARTTFFGDNRADLPRLGVPSLILQVRDDAVVPVEVGRYLHAQLRDSEFSILEASGHCPHVSHPELTASAITAFLGRAPAGV